MALVPAFVPAFGLPPAHAADAAMGSACHQALQALQAGEERLRRARAALPSAPGSAALSPEQRNALARLQRAAARDCLGSDAGPGAAASSPPAGAGSAPPQRNGAAPVQPRTRPSSSPGMVAPAGPPAPPRAAVPQPPLNTITACDAAGCWASDGTRLNRMGSGLLGPRGLCTQQGAVLSCP